ncbi:MAG: hypothetical protein JWP33_2354 [Blastococcus sp.]|jgi:hypothetical protein|nr:hypothetical protein [Blastococcus sp.]
MAEMTVGIGTSHGPQLNMTPAMWRERAIADRANNELVFRGKSYDFESLRTVRAPGYAMECEPPVQERRHAAARDAISELGRVVAAADVDVLLVISSDHKEVFTDELLPPFTVYWGSSFQHEPLTEEDLRAFPPGVAEAEVANVPVRSTKRLAHAELALHVIRETSAAGFDPAASKTLPAGRFGNHGIPHGWGFVLQQVLQDADDYPAVIPLFVNTFYEPTAPSPARCYEFGAAVGAALASFPGALRIGVVASGGLSHFVIDEELDRGFLQAILDRDEAQLKSLDAAWLQSGTSELRSWLVAAGALSASELQPRIVGYEPCYRTEGGTGCAMAFVAWEPGQKGAS